MTTENGAESTVETTYTTAPEAVVSSQDVEGEARKRGWTPKEEWKGNPNNWKDAETYVEHSDDIVRITKSQLAKERKDFEERMGKMEKVHSRTVDALTKVHEKEMSELRTAKTAAVKAGNVAEVERLDTAIDDLKADAPKADAKMTAKQQEAHNEKVQKDWMGKHDWWDTDDDMTAYAIGQSQRIASKNPDITIEDNLAQVEVLLTKKYPEKFGGKPASANGHALVDGGGDLGSGPSSKDPLGKLPAEARAQAKSDMAKFPKVYPTAADWLKVYNS